MNTQGRTYTVVFTFLAAFVFVLALAFVNWLLQDKLSLNSELARDKSVLRAVGVSFTNDADALAVFSTSVKTISVPAAAAAGDAYFSVQTGGETAYVAVSRGKGLWGTITLALAVNADGTRIIGLDVVAHNETPGLGGRIDEAWFKDQFRGEMLSASGTIALGAAGSGDADHGNAKIDAITGASITSRLFIVMANDALARLRRVAAAARSGGVSP